MKEKDQYNLDEAVKELYQVEPLRGDFARIVADKAFAAQKNDADFLDKILLVAVCLVFFCSLIYGFSLLSQISVAAILIFTGAVMMIIGLSLKEHFILLKRINDAH